MYIHNYCIAQNFDGRKHCRILLLMNDLSALSTSNIYLHWFAEQAKAANPSIFSLLKFCAILYVIVMKLPQY